MSKLFLLSGESFLFDEESRFIVFVYDFEISRYAEVISMRSWGSFVC